MELLVFAMSLLAILSFCSLTQNWMLVRNRLWESAVLFGCDRRRCSARACSWTSSIRRSTPSRWTLRQGGIPTDPGQIVRFHVVRETRYGDRFKLFALETPEPDRLQIQGPFGVTLGQGPTAGGQSMPRLSAGRQTPPA